MRKRKAVLGVFLTWVLMVGTAQATNLLRNGSFEVGTFGWTWETGGDYDHPDAAVRPQVDRTTPTAARELGGASVRLEFVEGVRSFTFRNGIAAVKPGVKYTFSFYARSDPGCRAEALACDGFQIYHRLVQTGYAIGPQWQRYTANFTPISRYVYVCVWDYTGKPHTLWLDGLQLEEGQATSFVGWRPVEAGVMSDQLHNTYHVGDKVSPRFYFSQHDGKGGAYTLAYRTEEALTGKVIGEKRKTFTLNAGAAVAEDSCPYLLPSDRRGIFKTTVQVLKPEGDVIDSCEYIYAVFGPLPPAKQFMEDSLFAVDHLTIGLAAAGRDSVESYFKMASEIGVRWNRDETLRFRTVEPVKGEFHLDDGRWRLADRYKIGLMPTLGVELGTGYIPTWARTDQYSKLPSIRASDGRVLPAYEEMGRTVNLDAWYGYVYNTVKHFKGRIKYWEVLNECYGWPEYPDYLRVANKAIKDADPEAKTLCNIMLCEFDLWKKRVKQEKEYPNFDILSLHIYQQPENCTPPDLCVPSFEQVFAEARAMLRELGSEKPVWETEGGFTWDSYYSHILPLPSSRELYDSMWPGFPPSVDKRQQQVLAAAYNTRKIILYTHLRCGKYFYFTFNHGGCMGRYDSLLEFDDTPKMAYIAYGQSVRMLEGAQPLKKLDLGEKVHGYVFRKGGDLIATIWNTDDRDAFLNLRLPGQGMQVLDMLGNPVKPEASGGVTSLPISGAPLYVVGRQTSEANIVKAFEDGEAVGLVPFKMAVELARDPQSGNPAAAVLVRNVGTRGMTGEFRIAGYPEEWNPLRSSITIGPVATGKVAIGYVPFPGIRDEGEPVYLKAFHSLGEELLEAGRKLPKVALCPRLPTAPRIDGDLAAGEWDSAAMLRINQKDQVVLDIDEETYRQYSEARTWQGPQDLSADVYVTWDAAALYLGAHVTAPRLIQNKADPSKIFNSSCLELFLSLNTLANAWDYLYKPSDYHLLFAPAAPGNPKECQYAVREMDKPMRLTGVQVASRAVTGGWQMEVRLPWANFEEFRKAQPGSVIGFDVAIDSVLKNGDRQYQMAWAGTAQNCARVDGFGRLVLVSKEEFTVERRTSLEEFP